jgi:hypothetical protein
MLGLLRKRKGCYRLNTVTGQNPRQREPYLVWASLTTESLEGAHFSYFVGRIPADLPHSRTFPFW